MTFIDQWLRSDIRNINAYHVPSAKNMLKMDAMESPFGVPEELKDEFPTCIQVLREHLNQQSIYTDLKRLSIQSIFQLVLRCRQRNISVST